MTPIQRVELLRAACCVAAADGEITDGELVLLRRLAADVGVGRASFQAMLERASRDSDFSKSQFVIFNENRSECIAALMEIAVSDGTICQQEEEVLRTLASNLKVSDEAFEQVLQQCRQLAQTDAVQ